MKRAHVGVCKRGLGLALRGGGQLGRHALELAPRRLADPGQLHLKGLLLVVHAVQAARSPHAEVQSRLRKHVV